ncbi:PorT family protein [Aureispira anguillae]|uniref:PorT family protein n=1 Tax=Aureispira anguillae TaxID=2864201 RepID=A0A915YJ41_9BACT|nr:PorT family protein [Aureispira anguillae]BDS14048.1 PorT family protein [Aureispira anguillae]
MLRKIAILTILLAQVVYVKAQEIKFGVHVDPFISFLGSQEKQVASDGINGGTALGVEVEYRFTGEENYAITFGLDFALNSGGSLLYRYGGVLFPKTDLDPTVFRDIAGGALPNNNTGSELDLHAFTKVNYRINYLQLPIGLKLRTNELGGSYMRAFFHIPLIKIMIPVTAGAKIFSPGDVAASANGYVDDVTGYRIPAGQEASVEPNVWKDITPIQVSLGAGAGVEFTPNAEGGLRLYAGVYYDAGIIDVVGGFGGEMTLRAAATVDDPATAIDESLDINAASKTTNPYNMMHNINLKIGVLF